MSKVLLCLGVTAEWPGCEGGLQRHPAKSTVGVETASIAPPCCHVA